MISIHTNCARHLIKGRDRSLANKISKKEKKKIGKNRTRALYFRFLLRVLETLVRSLSRIALSFGRRLHAALAEFGPRALPTTFSADIVVTTTFRADTRVVYRIRPLRSAPISSCVIMMDRGEREKAYGDAAASAVEPCYPALIDAEE